MKTGIITTFFIVVLISGGCVMPKNSSENESSFSKYHLPLLGKNVFVFDPTMDMNEIQSLIDSIYAVQSTKQAESSSNRYAFLFKPGTYQLKVMVGYYMQVIGLGESPDDVVIKGEVSSVSTHGHHVLTNFWRAAENLTIVPQDTVNTWAVSQASPLRRVHVKGNLKLSDGASSGGFMADCKIDGTVYSGSQQQWFTRNSTFKKWNGGVWNMMFVGVKNAPAENWPEKPYTTINETPEIREKPYWTFSDDRFYLKLPALKKNSTGTDWGQSSSNERRISMDDFYVAKPYKDNAQSINQALKEGKNILFTPGIYSLSESLKITRTGTIMMGIGMATLVPENGNEAIAVADVDDVTVAGLLIDANVIPSETLMQVGEAGAKKNHSANPTFLYDLFFRVGGVREGSAKRCLVINSNDVVADHLWFWRADHGIGVGWNKNTCANGLIVNGDDVTIYGLFNEHFQEYQTIWNGENGRLYFYQSEMPYYPPSVNAWKHGRTNGYASYKVADQVKNHEVWGIGIYNVFFDEPIIVDQAIETPPAIEDKLHHITIFWLSGNKESVVKSAINGHGQGVNVSHRKSTMN